MKTEPFPFHVLEGSNHDVGRQHGQALGDRIQIGIDFYAEQFARKVDLEWPEVLRRADTISDRLRTLSPDLFDEMVGIASGSEQPTAAIVALNARTILLRTAVQESSDSDDDAECTTGALLPAATANGHTYVFGNWDQHERCLDNSAFLEVRIPGKPALFMLTEAGILMRTGFNEHGIGITGNSLVSDQDTGGTAGTPWPIVRRTVLTHDRIAPAIKEVFRFPRTHSGNHVLGDAEGFAVDLEATPREVFVMTPENDVIAHSNHFLTPGAICKVIDMYVGGSPSTLYRVSRVRERMRARHGEITVDDIKGALRDHFGHPQSVCAHPGPTNTVTVASHIADLTGRTMMISSGPPCENEYQTFRLEPS
jgi:isopenicillin-N N-acyltransferase-like protein